MILVRICSTCFRFVRGFRRSVRKLLTGETEDLRIKKENDEVCFLRREYRLAKDAITVFLSKSWTPIRIAWDFTTIFLENPGVSLRKCSIISPSEAATKTMIVEDKQEGEVCIPSYYSMTEEIIEKYESPKISINVINNSCVVGQTNIVTVDESNALISEAYSVSNGRADLSYGYLIGLYRNKAYIADEKPLDTIDKGICLIHPGSYNYYHFLIEVLSRIVVADHEEELRNYPILVDEVVMTIPNCMWLLNKVRNNHEIIWIKKNKKYRVKELVYTSSATWMPANYINKGMVENKDYLFSKNIMNMLRERTKEGTVSAVEPYRKVYVSRKDLANSRLINEKETEECFKRAGYEVVHPEELSIDDQIRLFHESKCVAGVTGGAITNVLFCQPGATLFCIIPREYNFHMYSSMAKLLGVNSVFFNATVVRRTAYNATDSFAVDLKIVKEAIIKKNIKELVE